MKKKICKILCFLLVLVLTGNWLAGAFGFKYGDGILSVTNFYEEQEDTIDVMCFGSSHIFENVNTAVLWDEYGIAGYDLGGSVQLFWNTFYYIKEALKTQHPELIIMDVYGAVMETDYSDHSRIIKNNFGLKFSKDKIESVMVSAPKEDWMDYLLQYPTYHSRYKELERADFEENFGNVYYENWKGFIYNKAVTPYEIPKVCETKNVGELTEKTETYLQKIIDLTKEEGIPLLLIKSPYILTEKEQEKFNRVAEIAEENGIPFINYNSLSYYEDMGLDFSSDYADLSHLNCNGNVKFTRYLADYLKENYEIPDRRGENGYESWQLMANHYKREMQNIQLSDIGDFDSYINTVSDGNYLTVYSMTASSRKASNYAGLRAKLAQLGINTDGSEKDMVWVLQNGEVIFSADNSRSFSWNMELGEMDVLTISVTEETNGVVDVNLNRKSYRTAAEGLNVLVYDEQTEVFIECAGFKMTGNTLEVEKTV